jgi:hypothetical protein
MAQSFTHMQQLSLQKGGRILTLITSKDETGLPFYLYLTAKKDGFFSLEKAYIQSDNICFSDYGEVIYQDWGTQPTDDIKATMEEHYGFVHP